MQKIKIMKKLLIKIITVFILLSGSQSFSQNYFPFPDSNAIWNTVGENMFSGDEFRVRYGLYGDTTINSQTYHKIYNLYDTNLIHQNSTYFAALRNDNKKVIINIPGYPETVLYDFLLSVGDTIWYEIGGEAMHNGTYLYLQSHWKTVVSIDSVILENGEYRKRWHLNSNIFMSDTWIEGVGSVDWFGLFNPIITDAITNGDNYYFACFKHNNQVVHINNPLCDKCFCQLYTTIDKYETDENEIFKIFPNPATDKIFLQLNDSELLVNKIVIYNSIGTKVYERFITRNDEIELSLNNYESGLYTIQIINNEELVVGIQKLIVE